MHWPPSPTADQGNIQLQYQHLGTERERAFEDLKKGQMYVAETLKKDTKDN